MHTTHCQEFLPCPNFYIPGPFTFIFSKSSPYFLTVLVLVSVVSPMGMWNKIGQTAQRDCTSNLGRFLWWVLTEYKVPKRVLCTDRQMDGCFLTFKQRNCTNLIHFLAHDSDSAWAFFFFPTIPHLPPPPPPPPPTFFYLSFSLSFRQPYKCW